jgi:hypothetical protein
MKLRFSIRAVFIATTIFGCILYWRVRPAIVANEFQRAVADKNYEVADGLLAQTGDLDFATWSQTDKDITAEIQFDNPTIVDWLLGRRRGRFSVGVTLEQCGICRECILTASATGVTAHATSECRNDLAPEAIDIFDLIQTGFEWVAAANDDIAAWNREHDLKR